jgi:hypothetical protein
MGREEWSYAHGSSAVRYAIAPAQGPHESRINMRHETSTTQDAESIGPSPLRLRVGVALIILWLIPFWALAPYIAHSLSGLSNPPSVAAVTTTIVVVQTIIGLLGFWVAGTEVKSIIKGSTMKRALSALWSMFIHGEVRGHDTVGTDPSEGRPPPEDR